MKKLFFLVALLLFVIGSDVTAQIGKGSILVSGGIRYIPVFTSEKVPYLIENSTDQGEYQIKSRVSASSFGVSGGYALSKNLVVGMSYSALRSADVIKYEDVSDGVGISQGKDKDVDVLRYVGPYAQYYLYLGKKENFAISLTALLTFINGKSKTIDADYIDFAGETEAGETTINSKTRGLFAGFAPGLSFFLNDRVIIQTSFGSVGFERQRVKIDPDGDDAEWSDPLNISVVDFSLTDFNLSSMTFGLTILFGGDN